MFSTVPPSRTQMPMAREQSLTTLSENTTRRMADSLKEGVLHDFLMSIL